MKARRLLFFKMGDIQSCLYVDVKDIVESGWSLTRQEKEGNSEGDFFFSVYLLKFLFLKLKKF